MSGSIWAPDSTETSAVSSQRFVATAAQVLFSLSAFTYTPNINAIMVFVNGAYKQSGVDYTETSSSSITFVAGLSAGDKVTIVGLIALIGAGVPGFLSPSGSVFVTGQTATITGAGVVLDYNSTTPVGRLAAYDFTNSVYKNLNIDALTLNLNTLSMGGVVVGGDLNVSDGAVGLVDTANENVITIFPTNAGFTSTAITVSATRVASTLFDFANFKANNVTQFKVDGVGNITSLGTLDMTGNISARADIKFVSGGFGIESPNGARVMAFTNGAVAVVGTLTPSGAFGCNGATAQTALASGGAMAAYVTGGFGLDSDVHMTAMYNLVKTMRTALVANGIMS